LSAGNLQDPLLPALLSTVVLPARRQNIKPHANDIAQQTVRPILSNFCSQECKSHQAVGHLTSQLKQ